jgi:hypothetical protein
MFASARFPRPSPTRLAGLAVIAGLILVLALIGPRIRRLQVRALPAAAEDLRWGVPVSVDDDASAASQRDASVISASDGSLHALWVDSRVAPGDALYYARLLPGAERWSANLRVWHAPAGASIGQTAIALDGLTQVHAAWELAQGGDADIAHALLPAGSRAWSSPHIVNDDAGHATQARPAMAVDPYGTAHLVWEDYRKGGADLYYAARVSSGEWIPNQAFDHPTAGDQRRPALAMAPDGWLYAAWLDGRNGGTDVYASRLPPGGHVWWPNSRLSARSTVDASRGPRLASDALNRVHALWIEAAGSLQLALLPGRQDFWQGARPIYSPERGRLLEASVAAGPGGRSFVAWRESREDEEGSRIYAAQIPDAGQLAPSRVDGSRIVTHGAAPLAAIDALSRFHVIWQGRRRDDPSALVHASVSMDPPSYLPELVSGRLSYFPRRFNCGFDGYVVRDCEGAERAFIISRGLDLEPFLGSPVEVGGYRVADTPCGYLVATSVRFTSTSCPRSDAILSGQLSLLEKPVEGARVHVGDRFAFTGPSGRFYLDGLTPASQTITATAGCALTASLGEVELRRGLNRLPPGQLEIGDIVPDCKVGLSDVVRVAGQLKSEPPFDPECADLDGDGRMSLADLAIVAARYGESCPTAWAPTPVPSGLPGATSKAWSEDDAPGLPIRLIASADTPIQAWTLRLHVEPGSVFAGDLDPDRPGRQVVVVDDAIGPVYVVENLAGPDEIRLSGARLGRSLSPATSAAMASPGLFLGRLMLMDRSDGRFEASVEALDVYDADGRRIESRLLLDGRALSGAPAHLRLNLPWIGR